MRQNYTASDCLAILWILNKDLTLKTIIRLPGDANICSLNLLHPCHQSKHITPLANQNMKRTVYNA